MQSSLFRVHSGLQPRLNRFSLGALRLFAAPVVNKPPAKKDERIINKLIPYASLRVIYQHSDGTDKNEVMTRAAALELAKGMKLDLILVKSDAEPPVCKIADSAALEKAKLKKEKEVKAKIKEMREVHIGANIGDHDLEIKMQKIKEFLNDGCEVKTVVNSNKKLSAANPGCMDRTVLKLLEKLDGLVDSIRQPAVKFSEFRKDFILSPKTAVGASSATPQASIPKKAESEKKQ